MKFKLPNYEKEITAKGRVVRAERENNGRYGIGIEFLEIENGDIQAINSLATY